MLVKSKSLIVFSFLLLLPFSIHAQNIQWASDISMRPQAPKAGEGCLIQRGISIHPAVQPCTI